ncbi:MAG: hypothetical protein U1G07_13620 [Verrucomicrobiota bacterium]
MDNTTGSTNVIVAVIDSTFDIRTPATWWGGPWHNPTEIAGNGG